MWMPKIHTTGPTSAQDVMSTTTDLGPAEFLSPSASSTVDENFLICPREPNSNVYNLFRPDSYIRPGPSGPERVTYYVCEGCRLGKPKKLQKAKVTVGEDGRVVWYPAIDHKPNCRGLTRAEVEAKKLLIEAKAACQTGGRSPKAARLEMMKRVRTKFEDVKMQSEVFAALPGPRVLRLTLSRLASNKGPIRRKKRPTGPIRKQLEPSDQSINSIDQHDQADQGRRLYHEEPNFRVLTSEPDLTALARSEYIVCDGTFKAAPHGFLQFYVINGINEDGQGVPLCLIYLKDKSQFTFQNVFAILRDRMHRLTQNQSRIQHILMDFDPEAHEAARFVFQAYPSGLLTYQGQGYQRLTTLYGLQSFPTEGDDPLRYCSRLVKALAIFAPDVVEDAVERLRELLQDETFQQGSLKSSADSIREQLTSKTH